MAAFLPTLLAEDRTRRGWTVEQVALYDCILVDQRVGSVSQQVKGTALARRPHLRLAS